MLTGHVTNEKQPHILTLIMDVAGVIFLPTSIFVFFEVGQYLLSFQSFILLLLLRVTPAPNPLIDGPIGKPGDFPHKWRCLFSVVLSSTCEHLSISEATKKSVNTPLRP